MVNVKYSKVSMRSELPEGFQKASSDSTVQYLLRSEMKGQPASQKLQALYKLLHSQMTIPSPRVVYVGIGKRTTAH